MKDNNIDKNYEFYEKNYKQLKSKYLNEYLVIANEDVKFHSNSFEESLSFAKKLEAGTYIIQQCKKEDDIQMFHSRVWVTNVN